MSRPPPRQQVQVREASVGRLRGALPGDVGLCAALSVTSGAFHRQQGCGHCRQQGAAGVGIRRRHCRRRSVVWSTRSRRQGRDWWQGVVKPQCFACLAESLRKHGWRVRVTKSVFLRSVVVVVANDDDEAAVSRRCRGALVKLRVAAAAPVRAAVVAEQAILGFLMLVFMFSRHTNWKIVIRLFGETSWRSSSRERARDRGEGVRVVWFQSPFRSIRDALGGRARAGRARAAFLAPQRSNGASGPGCVADRQ